MTTDTTERGLERLICTELAGHPCDPPAEGTVAEPPAGYGGVGWSGGNFHDYEREYCVDLMQLAAFLRATQPEAAEALALSEDGPTRRAFPDPAAGRDRQARHDRRAAQRDQARSAAPGPVLRRALRCTTRRRGNGSSRTVSRSPGSFVIAGTRGSGRWTSGCSSTGCRCSPSS